MILGPWLYSFHQSLHYILQKKICCRPLFKFLVGKTIGRFAAVLVRVSSYHNHQVASLIQDTLVYCPTDFGWNLRWPPGKISQFWLIMNGRTQWWGVELHKLLWVFRGLDVIQVFHWEWEVYWHTICSSSLKFVGSPVGILILNMQC